MPTWNKYEYVCPYCDSLVTYTTRDERGDINPCPICPERLTLMSVVDVTIPSINEPAQQEEIKMEQTIAELYNPNLLVTYKKIIGGDTEYGTEKVADLEWTLDQARKSFADRTLFQNQRFLVDNIINSSYEDSEDKDTLREIAKALDISLTKEVSWTATVTISGTVDVDLTDEDFDLESHVSDEISGSLYDYDYSIENVEEN